MHLLHRSNDTGHWRGSNDSLKIIVRNWLRPLAADTGRVREVAITDQLGAHCQRRLAAKKAAFRESEGSLFYGNYTSSMTAISAASPRRGPVRVTLV